MANETKITYLFGAGASAGNQELIDDREEGHKPKEELVGIPVVKSFNQDIGRFLRLVFKHQQGHPYSAQGVSSEKAKKFYHEFSPIFDEFKNLYSFDTFAKTLYESSELTKLKKLKFLLRSYLIYRQYVSHRDKRYDLFFASLINNRTINPAVNFLSWNYDTQIEMSLSAFNPIKNAEVPKFSYYVSNPITSAPNELGKKSLLIKLNGSISYEEIDVTPKRTHTEHSILPINGAMMQVMQEYEKYLSDNVYFNIEFSWESKYKREHLPIVNEIITQTSILVVIGYSFPTLNRRLDADILSKLSSSTTIYVQCLNEHFEGIKTRIKALLPYKYRVEEDNIIQNVNSIDEFYIPFELQ